MIRFINNENKTTRIEKRGDVEVIRPVIFDDYPFIDAFFSTRMGGVSKDEFASMNLGYNRGDERERVDENYRIIKKTMGLEGLDMIKSKQTHTCNVFWTKDLKGRDYNDVDGLVTASVDEVLVTSFADCVPVMIVDVNKRMCATLHSGWKGTLGNIIKNGISMLRGAGCDVADMKVFIGPSICKDCYEIGADVADKFRSVYSQEDIEKILGPMRDRKYYLDLHEACRLNLLHEGIPEENISVTDMCTACNGDYIFSHRKSHGLRGTMCGFIRLKDGNCE